MLKKLRKPGVILAVYILLAVFLIGAVVISVRQRSDTPDITLPENNGESVAQNAIKKFPALDAGTKLTELSINKSNVRNVLIASVGPQRYDYKAEKILYYGDTKLSTYIEVIYNGSRCRLLVGKSSLMTNMIISGKKIYTWINNETTYTTAQQGDFTPEELAGIQSIRSVERYSDDDVLAGRLVQYNGELCVYAAVKDKETGCTEYYWVSADTGLLMHAKTVKNGRTLYEFRITAVNLAAEPEDSFELPDGITPE